VRSESTVERKLRKTPKAKPITEVERRKIRAEFAPVTEELESIMEEQLAELIDMDSAFDQKAKTMNDQFEYDEDWEKVAHQQ